MQFIHISDTHIHPDPNFIEEGAQFESVVGMETLMKHIKALPFRADFVLHTGDIVYHADAEAYAAVQRLAANFNLPMYYVAGNLDDARLIQTLLMGRAESELQAELYYTFAVNDVQIACLDSNRTASHPVNHISDVQLDWLRSLCNADDDRPLIVAVHHNPLAVGVPWLDNKMRITNGDALHELFLNAHRRPLGVFHGHIHQNIEVVRDGIPYSSVASSCFQFQGYIGLETPFPVEPDGYPGYSVVTVTDQQLFCRRYAYRI